ncbi:MAG: hypothetical protein WCS65_05870 [Verrucomicrobiae bacterium]
MKYVKHIFMFMVGLLSLIYLANPGAGIVELIPDNIPGLGNIDEGLAAFLLLNCLAYFGLDLRDMFSKQRGKLLK